MTATACTHQSTPGTLELLVVQATPFCDLNCTYCYLPDRSSKRKMTEATLEKLFQSAFASPFVCGQLKILWHAGEPLVLGIAYYQHAFATIDRLNRSGVRLCHSFQTNGTLLDQDWIDFFRLHNVKVGISLDGPQHLHDCHRRTRNNGATFEKVMKSVRLLQTNKYPFHVITVLTRDSLSAAHDLFQFYIDNRISDVGFNIEEIEGRHRQSSLQYEGVDKDAATFFQDMLALVESHPGRLNVREFAATFEMITNPRAAAYGNPQTEPMRIVTVGVDGDLSTFSPELLGYRTDSHHTFVFGNVHTDGFSSIPDDPHFVDAAANIRSGIERCKQTCDYFELCLGGAPANKLFENGTFDSADTLYCRLSKKALIDVMLRRVELAATENIAPLRTTALPADDVI